MDLQEEKNRLLDLIEVENFCAGEIDIKIENIDLNIQPSVNNEGFEITIVSDITIDPSEIAKYDKNNSEIEIYYQINDINYDIISDEYNYLYFDINLLDNKFNTNYKFEVLNLEDIGEIMIEVNANLSLK